jgi:DnaJ-domain-containing protein 1
VCNAFSKTERKTKFMDVLLSLNSGLISISKPYQHHILPLSNRQPRMQFCVSCRATKNVSIHNKLDDDDNLYKILCLSPKSATMDDIKRAYRTMALQYHPDVCHDRLKKEESTRMFVQLNAAYETLSNPKLKEEYDFELSLGLRRSRWMEQMVELNRRSHAREAGSSSSWGSRMRAKNNVTKDDHDNN